MFSIELALKNIFGKKAVLKSIRHDKPTSILVIGMALCSELLIFKGILANARLNKAGKKTMVAEKTRHFPSTQITKTEKILPRTAQKTNQPL